MKSKKRITRVTIEVKKCKHCGKSFFPGTQGVIYCWECSSDNNKRLKRKALGL